MSCKYCEYPNDEAHATNKKTENGESYVVEYDVDDETFSMFTFGHNATRIEIHKVSEIKYCPFCGEKLRVPSEKVVEANKRFNREWAKRQEEVRKEQEKKKKEHEKWLRREYKNNPYDPTKPRLKDKNFRNAVKYLAKALDITEFYWDDELRRLSGWNRGCIDLGHKSIGPCYRTNGVMESWKDSYKTYSVQELCYGYPEEEVKNDY